LSDPKRHHYVPEVYLKGFIGDDDLIECIEKPSAHRFSTQPINAAVGKHMNTVKREDGTKDQTSIEDFFHQFETSYPDAIKSIDDHIAPPEASETFINFAISQRMRTPRVRTQLARLLLDADSKGMFSKFNQELNAEEKRLLSEAQSGEKAALNQLGMRLSGHFAVATGIQLNRMHFAYIPNRTATPFRTCDNPVIISGISSSGSRLQATLPTPNQRNILIMPLNTGMLMYGDTDTNNGSRLTLIDKTQQLQTRSVKQINRLLAISADRFIFQPNGSRLQLLPTDVKQGFDNPKFALKLYKGHFNELMREVVPKLRKFVI
jgi:hypothetical protein